MCAALHKSNADTEQESNIQSYGFRLTQYSRHNAPPHFLFSDVFFIYYIFSFDSQALFAESSEKVIFAGLGAPPTRE
jgi:hypothetical protein